jgi:hypothetical protein
MEAPLGPGHGDLANLKGPVTVLNCTDLAAGDIATS